MKRRRREIESAGLSFLDCICCGFGAIILLLVISKIYEPILLGEAREDLESLVVRLRLDLEAVAEEVRETSLELASVEDQLAEDEARATRLHASLESVGQQVTHLEGSSKASAIIEEVLRAEAKQRLNEAQRRLEYRTARNDVIGGIPVDSEYIIFVVDTSGSMQTYNWDRLLQKVQETLEAYPRVKGIQILNDMGDYMFSQYAGRWIPDSPARRRAILQRLRGWQAFSNSSPVEGIEKAIRTFYASDKKISIYVLGDEFTGPSIQDVVDSVDRLNRKDARGNRRVRIHAIAFPIVDRGEIVGTIRRFGILMRILCQRNGGTFVGLRGQKLR